MANFNTHLTVATSVSATLAIGLFLTDLAPAKAVFLYWLLGTLGGILPDIDAPNSIPTRLLFTSLGIFIACFLVTSQPFSWLELTSLWIVTYLSVRYGLSKLFDKLTVHRGNFHSILAALLFGFVTTATAYQVLEINELLAWFAGVFVTVGYLVHLLLDELYNVDLTNAKLKKSFGTALKIASFRHKFSTVLLLLASLGVFLLTPPTEPLVKILSHHHIHLSP
ncbi:MAG: metal-dependent hydrolase [Pseudomonadota bacterium]